MNLRRSAEHSSLLRCLRTYPCLLNCIEYRILALSMAVARVILNHPTSGLSVGFLKFAEGGVRVFVLPYRYDYRQETFGAAIFVKEKRASFFLGSPSSTSHSFLDLLWPQVSADLLECTTSSAAAHFFQDKIKMFRLIPHS